ncbi:hypothetical protein ED733_001385 [Metarhizium rileyi]|uniref:Uncharacterized protein n=1 Tax=Metarhizium rileyi (strain RCEF 4871) TaxID=1649241 RepID=A0A5C6GEI5_METRR|nr:hypothetical protein ED733_001385 [Metarhizium rileyi]
MSAKNDSHSVSHLSEGARTTYSPGRAEFEILQAYNSLIEAGGHPICSLAETTSISKQPGKHREILGPWMKEPSADFAIDWKGVFEHQLSNWRLFRAWQQTNRESGTAPDTPDIRSEDCDGRGDRESFASDYGSKSSKFEAHLTLARRLLSNCGFTKSFTFDMDSGRQDEWTTWIEYLSFECYCCDIGTHPRVSSHACDHASSLHPSSRSSSSGSPSKAHCATDMSGENKLHLDLDAVLKEHRTRSWSDESPPTSPSTTTYDGTRAESKNTHDTDHHNLILRWALLQEPKIAAKSSASQRGFKTTSDPLPYDYSKGPRPKRHRDGSQCSEIAAFENGVLVTPNDDVGVACKRHRSCA